MSLTAYNEAGYAPVPLRAGRPAVAGIFSNNPSWRYAHGEDARFADCAVGVLCSARPLSGASGTATLAACASTWVAGVRWETTDRKLNHAIAAVVEGVAGAGPLRVEGFESLRVFRLAEWQQPFITRGKRRVYLPGEKHQALSYRPHVFEVLSAGAFCAVSGGRWVGGELPNVRRDKLPTLMREQADMIASEVEILLCDRGAMSWA